MLVGGGCKKRIVDTQTETFEEPPLRDIEASWSPDGEWLVYRHEDYNYLDSTYQNGLYIVDTNGNNRRLLLPGEALLPDWSPDGQKIAFSSGAIFTINIDDDSVALLVYVGRFPRWSPDGKTIVYTRGGTQDTVGIWMYDVETQSINRFDYGATPDWYQNGSRLVYSAPPPDFVSSESQIWTIDTSDTIAIQLTNNQFVTNRFPMATDQGNMITWSVTYEDGNHNFQQKICVMNSNGTGQRILHDGFNSSWSPDGKKIVFSNFNKNKSKYVLWTVNANGSGLKQITQ